MAPRSERTAKWPALVTGSCFLGLIGFLVFNAWVGHAHVEVVEVELDVSDLSASRKFFEEVLAFHAECPPSESEARLTLGDEILVLHRREGARVTPPIAANELGFQHLAIVVSDMSAAFQKLRASGVTTVDRPQRLPEWNRDVRGIEALYFKDPEGHFLELIHFPARLGEPRWQNDGGKLFLGIDHTAVVVEDSDRSRAFFRDQLGLARVGESFNSGAEQSALSGVPDAHVRVTSLRGGRGMGVELLEYRQLAGKTVTPDWRIHLGSDQITAPLDLTDPDGHRLHLEPQFGKAFEFAAASARHHWSRYWKEGAELGVFMLVTVLMTLLLEHPSSPIRQRLKSDFARRVIMGVIIGTTAASLISSPWGSQSGAQFNPSVTIGHVFLGRINPWDALFYVCAQFLGGWLGVMIASLPFRHAVRHEKVRYAVTVPQHGGVLLTLVAEFAISFILFGVLLIVQRQPSLKSHVPYFAGALLLLFITFEAPISGMSLSPARTVASAIPAGNVAATWPYFVAPLVGMITAAACFGD